MVICLERGANGLRMVQLIPLPPIITCFIKIETGLTFQAYPGCPGKETVKWVSVCLRDDATQLRQGAVGQIFMLDLYSDPVSIGDFY